MAFKKATKEQSYLRMNLHGPSGSGKTRSALEMGIALAEFSGGRMAMLDTERGSASKYSKVCDFDVQECAGNHHPQYLIDTINDAVDGGYKVLGIDSISHFWNGNGGFLELVDKEVAKMRSGGKRGDSFAAWKNLTPLYNKMVNAILGAPVHIINTMRAKQEYVKEVNERTGKTEVRKVGLAPEMRDSFIYECDIEAAIDIEHNMLIGKTRCDELDGQLFHKPGRDVATILHQWLTDGGAPTAEHRKALVQAEDEPKSDDDIAAPLLEMAEKATTADDIAALLKAAKDANLQGATRKTVLDAYQAAKSRVESAQAAE